VLFTLPQQALPTVAKAMAEAGATAPGAQPNPSERGIAAGQPNTVGQPETQTNATGQTNAPGRSKGIATGQAVVTTPGQGPQVLALAQDATGGAPKVLDTGSLTVLDNQVDATTGTIKLKSVFPNAERRLWPGGFVSVRLRTEIARDAIVVPPAAIQRGPRGAYVFVIGDDTIAKRRAVTVGYEDEQGSVIASGLTGGETVVIDGASRLSDGSKVSLAKPDGDGNKGPEQPTAPGTSRQRR
jgi:multidrug efflux system membrane fusion protein